MKPTLKLQQGQQLHLTPQLLQSIRLLQLDAQQLELEISQALETNPLLEREDELSAEELAEQDPPPGHESADLAEALGQGEAAGQAERSLDDFEVLHEPFQDDDFSPGEDWSSARAHHDGDYDPLQQLAAPDRADLRQHALHQLQLLLHDPAELDAAAWMVERIDDNGYLSILLPQLQAEAETRFGIRPARMEALRQILLHGDPCGYGALDLGECLDAQLAELDPATPGLALARRVVAEHLEALAKHDYAGLCRLLGVELGELQCAQRLILGLQPRPGEQLPESAGHYVIPDVRAVQHQGRWRVTLNQACAPRLRVNPLYEQMLGRGGEATTHAGANAAGAARLRDLLQEARWLTRGLAMRYDTLLRTATVIVERQQGFLDRGDEAMLPLTLREIADAIGMHESTVSRITQGKYLQTPRGTFELKYFFSSKLEGALVANTAIRAMVKRLIDAESPGAPLADDTIALMLARQGVHIARRTVAKYRDQLHIGPAKSRHSAAATASGRHSAQKSRDAVAPRQGVAAARAG